MKPEHQLRRDLALDNLLQAAAARRALRRIRAGLMMLPLVLAAGVVLVRFQADDPRQDTLVAPEPPVSRPEVELVSDEELLTALADQGPVLIVHADGSRQLLLTRPLE